MIGKALKNYDLWSGKKTMTTSILSPRNFFLMTFFILLLMVITEPALALNVEKIGKGVVGNDRVKMAKLKQYTGYAGIFFTTLGILVTVFRKHKFALQKRSDTHAAMGPFVIVIGVIMLLIGYVF